MNIGFIEDTYLRGGTQIWVVEAVKNFISQGENIIVIAPKNSYVAVECEKVGAEIFEYDWKNISLNKEKYKQVWTKGLSKMDVAVCTIHPPRNYFHCSVFAGECLRDDDNLSTALILKTGTIVPEYKREFYIPNNKINVEIICITNFTRKYLIENYNIPRDKIHLIYQGTEIDRFTSTKKSREESFKIYPLSANVSPVLASVGSLEKRKGQIILLKAIKKLISNNELPNMHLMIVGEGPDEKMLKVKTIEMGLKNYVTFFPFTNKPNYIFDRIDILILPSLYKEGLPNVLLESMSMGVPVISSHIAGVPEIISDGKTGYMVESGNVDDLARNILKLWSDKENYQKMKTNSKSLIEKKFNKKKQFKEFLNFFRKNKHLQS